MHVGSAILICSRDRSRVVKLALISVLLSLLFIVTCAVGIFVALPTLLSFASPAPDPYSMPNDIQALLDAEECQTATALICNPGYAVAQGVRPAVRDGRGVIRLTHVTVCSVGFPFRAFSYSIHCEVHAQRGLATEISCSSCNAFPEYAASTLPPLGQLDGRFGYRIHWVRVLQSILAISIVIFLIGFVCRCARTCLRLHRGKCINCAYQLHRHQAACSECGAT